MTTDSLEIKKNELEDKKTLLESQIKTLEAATTELRAKAEVAGEEVDRAFFDSNKEKYAEVDLQDLVVVGKVSYRHKTKLFEFEISNLSKGESLEVDKSVKDYRNETGLYIQQMTIMHILARSVRRYGVPDKTVKVPDDAEKAIEALKQINEVIFAEIWKEYNAFNRWINCALRFYLKNS